MLNIVVTHNQYIKLFVLNITSLDSDGLYLLLFASLYSESINTCADEIATVATDTFIFGSKSNLSCLNGGLILNQDIGKSGGINSSFSNNNTAIVSNQQRCNGELQNDRKKNVGRLSNASHSRRSSSFNVASSSSSSNFGGSALNLSSQSKKPWFIATRDDSSLDELKELNLGMWKENSRSEQQLDRDVLY